MAWTGFRIERGQLKASYNIRLIDVLDLKSYILIDALGKNSAKFLMTGYELVTAGLKWLMRLLCYNFPTFVKFCGRRTFGRCWAGMIIRNKQHIKKNFFPTGAHCSLWRCSTWDGHLDFATTSSGPHLMLSTHFKAAPASKPTPTASGVSKWSLIQVLSWPNAVYPEC